MIGPAAQRGQERYLRPHSQEVPGLGLCALPSHFDLSTQGDSLSRPEMVYCPQSDGFRVSLAQRGPSPSPQRDLGSPGTNFLRELYGS